MSDTALVSLFALLGTVIGTFGGILVSNKLMVYRIDQLEKKVDKHNCVIDRMYKAEARLDVNEEQMEVTNHRISDLEKRNER